MTYEEKKKLKEENNNRIAKLSDKDKLTMLVDLLRKAEKIDMFTDDSDTYGIRFTDEYDQWENDLEELLNAIDVERSDEYGT